VADDEAVAEEELRVDAVVHLPSRLGEGVARVPVRLPALRVGLHAGDADLQVGGAGAEHGPHRPYPRPAQLAERRVGEDGVRVVARRHAGRVARLEAGVEPGSETSSGGLRNEPSQRLLYLSGTSRPRRSRTHFRAPRSALAEPINARRRPSSRSLADS
jgi:hypothetical protein